MGIDFGKKGGFAVIDENNNIVRKSVMPVTKDNEIDMEKLSNLFIDILHGCQPLKVQGEKLHAIFGSSAKATFNFGHDYGVVKTIAHNCLGGVELVRAVDWQKSLFTKLETAVVKKKNSTRNDTKLMALHTALKLWPDEVWVESPRHRRIHDGMIDSALIAYDLKERLNA